MTDVSVLESAVDDDIDENKAFVTAPGGGSLATAGVVLYDIEGDFLALTLFGGRRIHLHSVRFGDVVDISLTGMEGFFATDMDKYIGKCLYTIAEIDAEGGVAELTILHEVKGSDTKKVIARLTGEAAGLGEAFCKNKKGHLHVHPAVQDNIIEFKGESSVKKITFELDEHIITTGEKFDGVHADSVKKKENHLSINVKAQRKGSKDCAKFFSDYVAGKSKNMIHTAKGSNVPDELNFAFTGTLTIDDSTFQVCMGQGHYGTTNNWHFSSAAVTASSDAKSGVLSTKVNSSLVSYELKQDGSHTFKVKKK